MDDIINRTLKLLELTVLEIKIFTASFKLGASTVPTVAKAAKVKRSTAYLLTRELVEKGYMLEENGKYSNKVQAISPAELQTKLAAKQRKLRRQEILFQDNFNALQSLYQSGDVQPKVRTYKGVGGLVAVWNDILSTKKEVLLWTNPETECLFFNAENHDKFIKERLSKKISIRVLAISSKAGIELKNADKNSLRETKLLPSEYKFSTEIYLYDNKVAMLDYNKDIIGITIESAPVSQSYKQLFEIMWKSVEY